MNLGERSEHEAAERSERAEAKRKAAPADTRILRVMRVECRRCEDRSEVWFDATRAYH